MEPPCGGTLSSVLLGVAAVFVTACGFVLLATAGQDVLPAVMQDNHDTPAMITVISGAWILSLLALAVLWRRRPHTRLDLWLMVVICIWLLDISLSAVLNGGRFDLGFYANCIYGLLAASVVLLGVLLENGVLYRRLAGAGRGSQQKAVDLERLRAQFESRVAEHTTALEVLNNKEEEFRAIVENLLDCVITVDTRGIVRSTNPALERVLGFTAADVIGRNVSMLMPEPHRGAHDSYLGNYLRTGVARIIGIGREVEGLHKDGRLIPLELAISEYVVRGEHFFIGTLRDIRERKRFIAEIEQLAFHDKLTGLSNRGMFSRMLEQGLQEAKRYNRQLAVLFVDLDRFKNINDTLGHEAGDLLLQEMATRLKSCVRASDCIGRLGGDEFVIMVPGLDGAEHLVTVAQKVLAAVSRTFTLRDHEFHVTASIGISVYPSDGDNERLLMKNADIAMYHSKEDGKNTFTFYSAELNTHSVERLAFESSLRRALDAGQFQVHYQPKVDCHTNQMNGVEALLRWNHPDLGPVSPAKVIPVAEESGLIVAIGRWVLLTACQQHVMWRDLGYPPLRMAVNLSARQFYDDHLLADVRLILSETRMDASFLELEITESMLMRDVAKSTKVLVEFKKLGIRLSLDDFGTGYSSLSNLKRFPIDTIKVDRSFVRELPNNAQDRAITEAIIAMGKSLKMTIVAEGVETQGQIEFLRDHDCDEFQGFYFSKAVSAAAIADLLNARPWDHPKDDSVVWGVEGVFAASAPMPLS